MQKTANTITRNCLSCLLLELFLMRAAGAAREEPSMCLLWGGGVHSDFWETQGHPHGGWGEGVGTHPPTTQPDPKAQKYGKQFLPVQTLQKDPPPRGEGGGLPSPPMMTHGCVMWVSVASGGLQTQAHTCKNLTTASYKIAAPFPACLSPPLAPSDGIQSSITTPLMSRTPRDVHPMQLNMSIPVQRVDASGA